MPPVKSAREAVEIADALVLKYYEYRKLVSAAKHNNEWRVVYDVGIIGINKVTIRVDAQTGDVLEYGTQG